MNVIKFIMKTVSDIGERDLIKLASSIYKKYNDSVDLNDDCAIIPMGDNYFLASSDMISEKTHIPRKMSPWQIGWFIIAINLSDIAAKGGIPLGVLLSVGLPRTYPESSFIELLNGASSCATAFNTTIIGGDTKEHETVVLTGTAMGKIKKNLFMSRKGAKTDDVVAVTGSLGKAAAGFYTLEHEQRTETVNRLSEPTPRVFEGMALAETTKVHCCMDISDGLSSSLYQLSELNRVGFEIKQNLLPISPELESYSERDSNSDILQLALHFGGDYELLLTTSKEDIPILRKSLKQFDTNLSVIGKVTKEQKIQLITDQKKIHLPNQGYEHFTIKKS
ncbi:MAG: thiamine-phosphate kinase [Candidatus Thermoplasmatota archaeon]|nr:thiamine-phosphate kinase [Candidatus Thermoplasmatota archaeon]